jgi:IclR family transcriptional regulator, KDG regulon repressor
MTSTERDPSGAYIVGPVWKALKVLAFVAESGRVVSLTEVADTLHLPKTTAFRYLHTLSASTFLEHHVNEDRYEIGARFRALARTDSSLHRLREVSLPVMRQLLEQFNETINLAIESGGEMIYIEVIESTRTLRIGARIGTREPMHTTALGKAFLAYMEESAREAVFRSGLAARTHRSLRDVGVLKRQLERVQQLGFAIETGENEDGALCVGVPILDDLNHPIGALSLSAPERRQASDLLDRATQALVVAGKKITLQMQEALPV